MIYISFQFCNCKDWQSLLVLFYFENCSFKQKYNREEGIMVQWKVSLVWKMWNNQVQKLIDTWNSACKLGLLTSFYPNLTQKIIGRIIEPDKKCLQKRRSCQRFGESWISGNEDQYKNQRGKMSTNFLITSS